MTIEISVTKEILEASKNCGITENHNGVGSNCAIAKAVWNLFPNVWVESTHINFYKSLVQLKNCFDEVPYAEVELPKEAREFIALFDNIKNPEIRTKLTPISFNIDIPEVVIENISIEEITNHLKTSKTMKLINV